MKIYDISIEFDFSKKIGRYIPTKKKRMYVVVYCGSALYSIILKHVAEEIFNIA